MPRCSETESLGQSYHPGFSMDWKSWVWQALRPAGIPLCPAHRAFGFLNCEVSQILGCSRRLASLSPLRTASCGCLWGLGPGKQLRVAWATGGFLMESCLVGGVSSKWMRHGKICQEHLISVNCFSFDELAFFPSGLIAFCGKTSRCCYLRRAVTLVFWFKWGCTLEELYAAVCGVVARIRKRDFFFSFSLQRWYLLSLFSEIFFLLLQVVL